MNIEMRHLRYFVAVAEEASFTAAAQRVHVTQQVLSTQIRQLEDAIGFELLRRTSRGVVLTAAGSAFLGFARETLASLDRGVTAARNAAQAVSGSAARRRGDRASRHRDSRWGGAANSYRRWGHSFRV